MASESIISGFKRIKNLDNSVSEHLEVYITVSRGKINNLDVKRFSKNITIQNLKWRLEILTGRDVNNMSITLLNSDHKDVCILSDNDRLFGSYPVLNGMILLVEDPAYVEIDEEPADRYQLTDEQYDQRRGTLKEFLIRNKIGKYDPDHLNRQMEQRKVDEKKKKELIEKDKEVFESIEVGQRCEIKSPDYPTRRGVVMFKGEVKSEGLQIGVKFDEPLGKHNGTVNGVKYFETPPKYGGLVRPCYVQTGDFPEICDLDIDSEEEF